MDTNKTSLEQILKEHEGLRLKPYKCTAGKLTIGYGRNLDDVGISELEAEYLLNNDIQRAETSLIKIFPDFQSFPKQRQDALIDMMFNLGEHKFNDFKKMIEAIKENDWPEAARQAKDSRWAKQVGKRAEDIISMLRHCRLAMILLCLLRYFKILVSL